MLQGAEWILERLYELERAKLQYEADNRRAHALTSFLRALNETEIYYGTLRESGKDRDREEELSRTWIEVSQELCIRRSGARKALRNESPILGRSGWLVSSAARECTHYDLRDARGFA